MNWPPPSSPASDPVRAAMSSCPSLATLPTAALESAMEAAWLRTLAADEAVYRAGDPGDAVFVVASGRIVARLNSPDGAAVDLSVAAVGTLFGYLELLGGGRRASDAVALGPSRVVVLGAALATRLFETCPALVLSLAREMAETVRAHTHATREQAFFTVPTRLARFLLDAADDDDRILLDGPQLLLAQRLGVARQTLSRALHSLAAGDLVRVDPSGRVITILDEVGLRAMTETGTRRGRSDGPRGARACASPADTAAARGTGLHGGFGLGRRTCG